MSEHHWQHSESINELAAALAEAQAEIKGAPKDSNNPFFKSKYADLGTVWDACRAQLTKHGLSVAQLPTTTSALDSETGAYLDRLGLTTILLHKSGQWLASTMYVQPKDTGAQAAGSALTYMRRYALSAVAGVPQIDDDGEAAEKRPAPQAKPKPEPAEPGSYDGDEGEVLVTEFKRASSKPGAPRPWNAGFVTLSNGVEGGTFDEALITFLENAHNTQKPIRYVSEPSKKDASKRTITAAQYAEEVMF